MCTCRKALDKNQTSIHDFWKEKSKLKKHKRTSLSREKTAKKQKTKKNKP